LYICFVEINNIIYNINNNIDFDFEEKNQDLNIEELFNNDKKISLKTIYVIFSYPTLFLHEFLHLFFGLIFGKKINDFYISSIFNKDIYGFVEFDKVKDRTLFESIIIYLSPLLLIIIPLCLLFININFIFLVIYFLLTIKFVLPSKIDVFHVLLFKYSKDLEDETKYIKFAQKIMSSYSIIDFIKKER